MRPLSFWTWTSNGDAPAVAAQQQIQMNNSMTIYALPNLIFIAAVFLSAFMAMRGN